MPVRIPLGPDSRVAQLFSYPNSPTVNLTLDQTVAQWFGLTLSRDGLTARGATVAVAVTTKTQGTGAAAVPYNDYTLVLDGPKEVQADLARYQQRLTDFLNNGWNALTQAVPKVVADGRWDPSPDQQPPAYHSWRFFLPLGMAMLNQKALNFFHYPPIRLLETNQDYLNDPVPARCEQLLLANGVDPADIPLFNTVLDATPIGAEDSQGSKTGPDKKTPVYDAQWGAIPINYFNDYQKAQVATLLNPAPNNNKFTVPIAVFGSHPVQTFNALYGLKLQPVSAAKASNPNSVAVASILTGQQTAVISSDHPYKFYAIAQMSRDKTGKVTGSVGSGKVLDGQLDAAKQQMTNDLIVMRWLAAMASDPTQDPQQVLKDAQAFWLDPSQAQRIVDLVNYQGSLLYSDPNTLSFKFAAPRPSWLGASAPAVDKDAPPVKANKKLQVIGDSGQPVDWWFMYKISSTAKPGKANGNECMYFDSEMAKNPSSTLVLAKHLIDDPTGPLLATISQAVEASPQDRPKRGWFCYNDEDHREVHIDKDKTYHKDAHGNYVSAGAGPTVPRGHCKGCLAFDLDSKTAFWLIHSVPLFPIKDKAEYPETGYLEAQSLLCIQLKDDSVSKDIAQLLFDAHGPNVNLASDFIDNTLLASQPLIPKPPKIGSRVTNVVRTAVPKLLQPNDPRLLLMQDKVGSDGKSPPFPPKSDPTKGVLDFVSAGGTKFKAMGKNLTWAEDFYDDMVSKVLNQDIEVETWEDTTVVPPHHKPGDNEVIDDNAVDLAKLNSALQFRWSESNDHAKLALSARQNPEGKRNIVCVGDINFTISQEKRGGGTVAFECPQIWKALITVLNEGDGVDKPQPPKKKAATKKTTVKKVASGSDSATKPAAKKAVVKRKASAAKKK